MTAIFHKPAFHASQEGLTSALDSQRFAKATQKSRIPRLIPDCWISRQPRGADSEII